MAICISERGYVRMFCQKCGNPVEAGSFCGKCGQQAAGNPVPPPPQPQFQQPQYAPQPQYAGGYAPPPRMPKVHYAPGSYMEKFHSFGGSVLFLVAICLFTAGTLINSILEIIPVSGYGDMPGYTLSKILIGSFALLIAALPIIGFWLIFVASKSPKFPEKSVPAIQLIFGFIIANFIAKMLLSVFYILLGVSAFMAAAGDSWYNVSTGGVIFWGIIAILIAGGIITFMTLYFQKSMKIVNALKQNVTRNSAAPLPGLKQFTLFAYIAVGFNVVNAIFLLVTRSMLNFSWMSGPSSLYYAIGKMPLVEDLTGGLSYAILHGGLVSLVFNLILNLVIGVGVIFALIQLNKFNVTLFGRPQPQYPPQYPPQPPQYQPQYQQPPQQ